MKIDPRALRSFLAICREGTITGAASTLNISQPSLSVAMSQLERAVGATLFHRSKSGIELTSAGQALRRRSEAMEALLRDTEEEIALVLKGVRGPLRVGGTPGALVSLLPQAVRILEAQSEFALHVLERPDRELIELLRKGEIDLAFVTTGIEEPPADIIEQSFAKDPFAVIVGVANSHLPDNVHLREVQDLRWVLPEAQGAFRRQVDALFVAMGVPTPREVIRCDSILTTKEMVRDSWRATILPQRVVASDIAMGTLRAVTLKGVTLRRQIGARWLRSATLSPLAQDIIDALKLLP